MIRTILVSLTLLLSLNTHAQKKNKSTLSIQAPLLSLREQALAESASSGEARASASDAQITASGMLTLKDPRPEILGRSWSYFAGFSAQSFQPEGTATKDTNTFDLADRDQTVMPGIEFGFLTSAFQTQSIFWKFGLRARGGFSSQGGGVMLTSGYEVEDARLNTTLLSVGPTMSASWERFSWLSLTFTPQFGSLIYTQTSSNDYAKFSKQAGYTAFGYGLDFQAGKQWSIFTEYSQRELNGNNEIALQKDNFELGTKVTW